MEITLLSYNYSIFDQSYNLGARRTGGTKKH